MFALPYFLLDPVLGPWFESPRLQFKTWHILKVWAFVLHFAFNQFPQSLISPKTVSNRAKNTANILHDVLFFLVFYYIFGGVVGCFSYSKMANSVSRTYANTFWIILELQKNHHTPFILHQIT